MTARGYGNRKEIVSIFVMIFLTTAGFTEELPVLTVFDFYAPELNEQQIFLAVDVLSYNIFESGRAYVLDRKARNKMLKGFEISVQGQQDDAYFCEIGQLLQSRFIIRGNIKKKQTQISVTLRLIDSKTKSETKSISHGYASFQEFLFDCRSLARQLTEGFPDPDPKRFSESRVFRSLLPPVIKERILFVTPESAITDRVLPYRELMNNLAVAFLSHKDFTPYFTSMDYQLDNPDFEAMLKIAEERDCHAFALVHQEAGAPVFSIFLLDLERQFSTRLDPALSIQKTRRLLINHAFPVLSHIPQKILIEELRRTIVIDRKLDPLLFNEKILAHRFSVFFYLKLIKSGFIGEYHPLLNIADIEGDFIWYFDSLLGIGAGYGFSYSYPALIDSKLSDHPLIMHHEIRLIPFCLRTAGFIGFELQGTVSLHFHDIYTIEYFPDESHTYSNPQTIIFLQFGLSAGITVNFSHDLGVYIYAAGINYAVVLLSPPEHMSRVPFSGDFGGIGIIYRF